MILVARLEGEDDNAIRDPLYDADFKTNPDGTLKATVDNLVWTQDSSGRWTGPAAYALDYLLDERASESGFSNDDD